MEIVKFILFHIHNHCTTHVVSKYLFNTVIGSLFCPKCSKFEARENDTKNAPSGCYRKRDKNVKKRLEIAKLILFHIHKHCTAHFISKYPFYTVFGNLFCPKCSKFEAGKNDTKMAYFRGYFIDVNRHRVGPDTWFEQLWVV